MVECDAIRCEESRQETAGAVEVIIYKTAGDYFRRAILRIVVYDGVAGLQKKTPLGRRDPLNCTSYLPGRSTLSISVDARCPSTSYTFNVTDPASAI